MLIAAVPGAIHGAIGEDAQEMSPVAAVQQFGFLIIPSGQVEFLCQSGESGDFPLGHPGAAREVTAGVTPRAGHTLLLLLGFKGGQGGSLGVTLGTRGR